MADIDKLIEKIEGVQFARGGLVRSSEAITDDLSGDSIIPLAEGARLVREIADQSVKADAGKPRLTLVPRQIIFDIAKVREYGVRKYSEGGIDNWKKVEVDRYRDAAYRHFMAYLDDPYGADEESGLSHLAHLATNIAFLCELEKGVSGEK